MNDIALQILKDQDVAEICEEYRKGADTRKHDYLGFNAFSLVSDLYYRENFHSDVLQAFLDMDGKHGARALYLHQFIGLLQKARLDIAPLLKCEEFKNYSTTREVGTTRGDGRIDVLILDNVSRKAIIIENKINGAVDTEDQLPKYLRDVQGEKGYRVVAIVYLSMSGDKYPEYKDWDEEEREEVEAVLIPVGAYTNNGKDQPDLVDHWLKQCIEQTKVSEDNHEDARALLRQYRRLLISQGASIMNCKEMKEFYDLIIEGDKYDQAKALIDGAKEMFDHIPSHFLYRLAEEYNVQGKREPFSHVSANDTDLIFKNTKCHGELDGITLFGTYVEEGKFVWSFYDEINRDIPSAGLKSLLDASDLLAVYSDSTRRGWDDRFQSRPFDPPTNMRRIKEIRDFLDSTLTKLRNHIRAHIQ